MKLKSNPDKTVLTITVGFAFLYLIFKKDWLLLLSISIGVLGLLSDYLALKIEWAWHKLSWILSLIVPNILLSILFYFLLFPIAKLSKLFSKTDPLKLKPEQSTWIEEKKEFDAKSLEQMW